MNQRLDTFLSTHKTKPAIDSRAFSWTEAVEAYEYVERAWVALWQGD